MNKKTLLITGALVVGAAGVLIFDNMKQQAPDKRLGKPLIATAELADIDAVSIEKDPASVKLVLDADKIWRIDAADGFPADVAKITRFLDNLTATNTQVLVSSTKEGMSEFGFETATSITLAAKDKNLAVVKLGGQRDRGGQYVAFGDDPHVYLVAQAVTGLPDSGAWELKTLADIKADKVQRIEFQPAPASGKKQVTLSREKAEDPIKAEGLPANALEAPSLRSHESILSSLSFSQRVDRDNEEYKAAMSKPSIAKVTLFDGRTYTVSVGSSGKDNKKYFVQIAAEKGASTAESDARELEFLNSLMARYAFEVPSYIGGKFEKGLDDMVEKKGS